jgi:DNA-binding LacI/PurR family transcriptional regulator
VPDAPTSYVAVDRPVGVAEAVTHLVRLGHTRIGYVGSEARAGVPAPHATKFEGFLRGLAAHGLSPDRVWSFDRFPWNVDHRPLWIALAEEIARVPDLPSALIVGSDALALALLAAFTRAGIRVPEDVALIGYDDVPAAATSVPALTTLAQPTQELAEVAVDLLLELIRDPGSAPRRKMLPPRLVIRESCGAGTAAPTAHSIRTLLHQEPRWTTADGPL